MIKSYSRLKKQNKERIKVHCSIQDTIPICAIFQDGIFLLKGNKYSKSFRFIDINYSIASEENKKEHIHLYEDNLNSFDASRMAKITVNNLKLDLERFQKDIMIPLRKDELDPFVEEYNAMLLKNLSKSENIIQEKYLTITVFKQNIHEARTFFSRITNELSAYFSRLGSSLIELSVEERLKILHDFYRNGEEETFHFDLNYAVKHGYSFKESISPRKIKFEQDHFKLNDKYGRVLYLSGYPQFI